MSSQTQLKQPLTLHTGSKKELSLDTSLIKDKIATMSINEFIEYPPVPDQRNEVVRMPKMKKAFIKKAESLRYVALARITKGFKITNSEGEEFAEVKPGIYRLDGNTRALYWKTYPNNRISDPLIVKIFDCNSQEELELEYQAHDNKMAYQTGNDDITTCFRKIGLSFSNKRLQSGRISTALKYAYPGGTDSDILDMVYYFRDELKIIDKFGLIDFHKSVSAQHIICFMLMGLKFWDKSDQQRLIDGFFELTNIVPSDTVKIGEGKKKIASYEIANKWNPMAILWREFSSSISPEIKQHLGEQAGSTKFADMEKQLDFGVYLMDRYINKVDLSYKNGINEPNYENSWTEMLKNLPS